MASRAFGAQDSPLAEPQPRAGFGQAPGAYSASHGGVCWCIVCSWLGSPPSRPKRWREFPPRTYPAPLRRSKPWIELVSYFFWWLPGWRFPAVSNPPPIHGRPPLKLPKRRRSPAARPARFRWPRNSHFSAISTSTLESPWMPTPWEPWLPPMMRIAMHRGKPSMSSQGIPPRGCGPHKSIGPWILPPSPITRSGWLRFPYAQHRGRRHTTRRVVRSIGGRTNPGSPEFSVSKVLKQELEV